MKKVPAQKFGEQFASMKREIMEAIEKVCASGQFILGDEVKLFEEEFSKWIGASYGIGVANGTEAIQLALVALGAGPGDEVITTPHTYFATGNAIVKTGARAVLVDIDLKSYNIDAGKIEERITKKTKAIVPVHLYGQACEMDKIMAIAGKHQIPVVEDCAQTHGTKYQGKKAGSFGDLGAFSFYPTKNLGAYGDGGIVTTSREDLAKEVKVLRSQGATKRYHHDKLGFNSRLDTLQAAILRVKLKRLDEAVEARRRIAHRYNQLIKEAGIPQVVTPFEDPRGFHTYHQYVIRMEQRDALLEFLTREGIDCYIYYPFPLHLTKALEFLGYRSGEYPLAEKAALETFALPIYPELTDEEQQYVVEKISEFYKR